MRRPAHRVSAKLEMMSFPNLIHIRLYCKGVSSAAALLPFIEIRRDGGVAVHGAVDGDNTNQDPK